MDAQRNNSAHMAYVRRIDEGRRFPPHSVVGHLTISLPLLEATGPLAVHTGAVF